MTVKLVHYRVGAGSQARDSNRPPRERISEKYENPPPRIDICRTEGVGSYAVVIPARPA